MTLPIDSPSQGSHLVPMGDEGRFVVIARSGELAVEEHLTVEVERPAGEGPRIVSFTGSTDRLTVGDELTFAWEVEDDPSGHAPTLALSDGSRSYDLSDVDPNQGSKSFVIETLGEHTFTLRASTPGGTSTSTHAATVHGLPTVTLTATPDVYEPEVPVTLAWTSEHADGSLAIHLLDEAGTPIEPPIHAIEEAARGSGNVEVHPTRPSVYRIVADNGAGAHATAEALVGGDAPIISSFVATPDGTVAGHEVTLSWTTHGADAVHISGVAAQLGETTTPFDDIRSRGGAPLTLTRNPCGSAGMDAVDEGCALVPFPADFTFPFGGTLHTSIVMHANGFLGFEEVSENTYRNLPLDGSNPYVAIAPFWDDLRGGTDSFHHLFGMDDRGKYLILQWSEMVLVSQSGSLTFQAVLWEDGSFEFRYADMTAPQQARADGSSATIGYQTPDGGERLTFHFGSFGLGPEEPVEGGLSHRSWRYDRPTLELNGSLAITAPAEDFTASLLAVGPKGTASAQVSIAVHPRAGLEVVWPEEEIEPGDSFTIAWTSTEATAVEVLEDGVVRCVAEPEEVAAGACTLTATAGGPKIFTVRATGALGHQVEEERVIRVWEPFEILAFLASSSEIDLGNPVALTWQTAQAASVSLTANGIELLDGSEPPDAGSIVHHPTEQTTYVLTATAPDGRTATASVDVMVRTFLFELVADSTDVAPGTPVTVSWNVTSLTGGTPTLRADWPLEEVLDGSAAFEDVSGRGQSPLIGPDQIVGNANVSLPPGFDFPFYGTTYSAARVSVDGWLSFDLGAGNTFSNQPIPSSADYQWVHLPIFWDSLHTQSGRVDAVFLPNPDRFIVQWTQVGRSDPITRGYDLNFQIALFPDGSFEYRYGTMAPPDTPARNDFDCNPLDCTEEAQGSSATIGYQDPTGSRGFQLHFGGHPREDHPPFAGGLANRSFRSGRPQSNSVVLIPKDTESFELCVELDGYERCETVTIHVDWGIHSFSASETSIDIGDSVTLQWLTRHADSLTLTANGEPVDIGGLDLSNDSIFLAPEETTNYDLILSSLGRVTSQSLTVEVRHADLQMGVSPALAFPGDPVSVSWSATALGDAPVFVYGPMQEIQTPFTDIRSDPDAVLLVGTGAAFTAAELTFEDGFEFPYLGEWFPSVVASIDGYLSFERWFGSVSDNRALPTSISNNHRVHIAPFWDDLTTRGVGTVHGLRQSDGSYVVQWSAMSKTDGSTSTFRYDLNFQVVLFPSGAIEFRYGDMLPPSRESTSCHPTSDCVGDANGASATIGYQDTSGRWGHQLHFGGGGQQPENTPFPGGLSWRSFRIDPSETNGAMTFHFESTEFVELCAYSASYSVCDEVLVDVVAPGDVVLTEVMIAPTGAEAPHQWFELRNTRPFPLNLEGFVISTDSGAHTIDRPLVVPSGGFAVLSRGSSPTLQADHAFDASVYMSSLGDRLAISAGTRTITQWSWDETWTIHPGQSLELDALRHSAHNHTLSSQELLCLPLTSYDGGSHLGTPGALGGTCDSTNTDRYAIDPFSTGPIFDIRDTGTLIAANFFGEVAVELSFAFPYFDEVETEIWMASEGYVTVRPSTRTSFNPSLPSSIAQAVAGVISPFWTSLTYLSPDGAAWWEERTVGGQKVAIFEWHRVKPLLAPGGQWLTVQLQLWEDGRIVFAYPDLVGTDPYLFGGRSTIGLQEPGGNNPEFLLYSYDAPGIVNGQRIEFTPVP